MFGIKFLHDDRSESSAGLQRDLGLTDSGSVVLDCLGNAKDFKDDIFDVLRGAPFLEDFQTEEIAYLCQYMTCFAASTFANIFSEGESGDWLAIVLTGEVAVVKLDADGQERILAHVGAGTIIGELSLLDGNPRFASCIAVKPTDIAVLGRDSVYKMLKDRPLLVTKFFWVLLQRMAVRQRSTSINLLRHLPVLAT